MRSRLAATKATLSSALLDDDFAVMIPLATRWADGVAGVIDDAGLAWTVQRARVPRRVLVLPATANGAAAAAAADEELNAFMHLWAMNRGILLTPFHNMALLSPFHTESTVDRHTEVFADAVAALLG